MRLAILTAGLLSGFILASVFKAEITLNKSTPWKPTVQARCSTDTDCARLGGNGDPVKKRGHK